MTIEQMRARLAEIGTELRAINSEAGDAALADEAQTRWDALESEASEIRGKVAAWERRQEALKGFASDAKNHVAGDQRGAPAVHGTARTYEPGMDVRSLSVKDAREMAIRALDNKDATAHVPTSVRSLTGKEIDPLAEFDKAIRKDSALARRFLVTETDEYRSAFMKLAVAGSPVLTPEEARAVQAFEEYRAMAEGTGSAGGYGIPVLIDPSIIMTTQGATNPFLQISRQTTVNTNAWKGVSSAGVTWHFYAEGGTVSDDSPTLNQPVVNVYQAQGFIPFSIQVDMDYPSFAAEMAMVLAVGYDDLLLNKFSNGAGAGSNEPTGLITELDGSSSQVRLTTAGSLGLKDIYNVWSALPQRFRNNASWMLSVSVDDAIRQLFTYINIESLQAPMSERYLGKPAYENAYFPALVNTTGHANQLVVGDFSNFLIARRAGMTVELVSHLVDVTNNRPTGQRGWFAYARIGAGSVNDNGFRLLNQT